MAENQHAGDHRQPAGTGNGQRHARALATFRQMLPVANQQEGRQAGQLPENEQQQDVVRQHDANHGALKEQQVAVKTAHRIIFREIKTGVSDDQKTDAEDQAGKEKAEAVEEEIDVEAKLRNPRPAGLHDLAPEHGGGVAEQQ